MGRRSSQPYYPSNQDDDIPPEQAGIPMADMYEDTIKQETPYAIEQMVEAIHKADEEIATRIAKRQELFDRLQAQTANLNRIVQERSDWFEGTVRMNPVPDRDSVGMEAPRSRYSG